MLQGLITRSGGFEVDSALLSSNLYITGVTLVSLDLQTYCMFCLSF